jgi:hypothetical protein
MICSRHCNPAIAAMLVTVMLTLTSGMAGCQSLGSVMTQIDLAMTVDASGPGAPVEGAVFSTERRPRSNVPFGYPGYQDELLEWRVQIPLNGIVMDFTSHAEDPIQLRWDQASWRSSVQPEWVALRVHRFSTGYLGKDRVHVDLSSDAPAAPAVALALAAGAGLPVNLRPEWRAVFPEGFMFGIRTVDKGYGFIDDGKGRWLELDLPVEMGDQAWRYRIRLTARAVGQWTSYH